MAKKKKDTAKHPTDRANLSQSLDQRKAIQKDPNGQFGRTPG